VWEERFEQRYGFWRVFVDDVVNAYLDCGRFESGFARVRCTGCGYEFLVATSCSKRGFWPSCGAKRAPAFAAFLADEVECRRKGSDGRRALRRAWARLIVAGTRPVRPTVVVICSE